MLIAPLPGRVKKKKPSGAPVVTQREIDEDMASFFNAQRILGEG